MPIRRETPDASGEFHAYLRWLSRHLEVLVVDGSPPSSFAMHDALWPSDVTHIAPEYDTLNGKVGSVLTGVARTRHERLVIADDDVRYDLSALARLVTLLAASDVVRPQNYFDPLSWHARWDTARALLNRMAGGDWPGTLGIRRSAVLAAGGGTAACCLRIWSWCGPSGLREVYATVTALNLVRQDC